MKWPSQETSENSEDDQSDERDTNEQIERHCLHHCVLNKAAPEAKQFAGRFGLLSKSHFVAKTAKNDVFSLFFILLLHV